MSAKVRAGRAVPTLSLCTAEPFCTSGECQRLLDLLARHFPDALPEHFGCYEPMRDKFDAENLQPIYEAFSHGLLWKRRNPKVLGMHHYRSSKRHGGFTIDARSSPPFQHQIDFIENAAIAFRSDLAYMHVTSRQEVDSGVDYDMWHPINLGLSTHEMRKYLPQLPWLTIFGKPYLDLFGADKILSSPGFRTFQLDDQHCGIQLTEDIGDMWLRFPTVAEARAAVKLHLGANAFYDPVLGTYDTYVAPVFNWPGYGEPPSLESLRNFSL